MSFAKLSSSIVTSTLWVQDHVTLRVFIALLASADSEGVVAGSIPGFASLCRVEIPELEASLSILSAPDKYSRSAEFEGRRIEIIPGGWRVINYAKYRDGRDDETRRQQNAAAQRRYRLKLKCRVHNADVSTNADSKQARNDKDDCKPESAHADADSQMQIADVDSGKNNTGVAKPPRTVFAPPSPEDVEVYSQSIGYPMNGQAWCDSYEQKGWMVGKTRMKSWKAAVRNWKHNGWMPNQSSNEPIKPLMR